jgi:hypothetical protein
MFSSPGNAFNAIKDRAVEASVKALLSQKIERFGALTRLQIDSNKKTMIAELALKGEATPILINVDAYELIEGNGSTYIRIQNVTASREWVSSVLSEFVVGRQFKIPAGVKMVL